MTPQSSFMIVAPLIAGEEAALRSVLASMTVERGMADPQNAILPFGEFERLHVARFLILVDPSPDDLDAYGLPRLAWPPSLAFLGDCDGSVGDFLADLAEHAGSGLRRIFSFCRDFPREADLLAWMKQHSCRPAAIYVNWIGRTVRQIREEAALRDALLRHLDSGAATDERSATENHDALVEFVRAERSAGRLVLSEPEPTPCGWQLCNCLHLIAVPLILLILSLPLLIYLPFFLWQLRARETNDKEIAPRPDPSHVLALADLEDHDVTNQFSAFGTVKPGFFRLSTVTFLLWLLDYAARHIYNRAYLTRVQTIHFARWVFLDGKKHLFFASNYDGSLESYMDDFINKVGWGLNLVFSNGVGYPRTNWLINDGSKDEQKFKYFLRRHELPTEVWYKAYPGLTTFDLTRNARIRAGVERKLMSDAEARDWLALL